MQTSRRVKIIALVLALAAGGGLLRGWAQSGAELRPGKPAPPFSLVGSDGKTYNLADFKGKQAVVLAWFVKAYSGG